MQAIGERIYVFLIGFFVYALLEVGSRGYTHWTMAVTGGIVMLYLYEMEVRLSIPLWQRCAIGALFITAMEFTVGVADNLLLGWNVWDYSDVPLNVAGQICLPFSGLWFLLCIPACKICAVVREEFEKRALTSPSGAVNIP